MSSFSRRLIPDKEQPIEEHLYKQDAIVQARLAHVRSQKEAQDSAVVPSFAPSVGAVPGGTLAYAESAEVLERMQQWDQEREERLEEARYRAEEEELAQMSLQPALTDTTLEIAALLPRFSAPAGEHASDRLYHDAERDRQGRDALQAAALREAVPAARCPSS